ncbi:class I glutamine amidotransferase-like protein [Talaromyces proteolyticus]|uniref:Class I glutamine amidotransferase-like protein n=1 Tax=Talaromyces proteolyticus TaxID=1131652 RepID=A0AAD4PW56_9EURO|nr:class I glutamine amidotransferase-like protein [Talaromyces proteolyticus]KAH8691164.1 class I glutamine amidotransferase-like protein [Talaromyces proteolyticus]
MAPIHIGSLVYDYQAMDVIGPFDLIGSGGRFILEAVSFFTEIDKKLINRAPEFAFHHIGETLDPLPLLTSSLIVKPTDTLETCPELDYLLVGGPNLKDFKLSPRYAEFIRRHVAAGKIVFTTCTGAAVLASTGVLDGKNATINNLEYEWATKAYPKVKWTKEKKWVVDGNIWTGSGAVAGMDMFAHWFKESFGFDMLIEAAKGLDYEPRDINGLFKVFPPRYDENGKQLSTLVLP